MNLIGEQPVHAGLATSTAAAIPDRMNGAVVTPGGLPAADVVRATGGFAVSMTATMQLLPGIVRQESDQVIGSRHTCSVGAASSHNSVTG